MITETDNEGRNIDTVLSNAYTYTLPAFVEDIHFYKGKNAIGNDLDNDFWGNGLRNRLQGMDGNDWLYGGYGVDVLDGGSGADRLDGGGHNDTLKGGDGDDTLDGYFGMDRLTGGGGHDKFVISDQDADIIVDLFRPTTNLCL